MNLPRVPVLLHPRRAAIRLRSRGGKPELRDSPRQYAKDFPGPTGRTDVENSILARTRTLMKAPTSTVDGSVRGRASAAATLPQRRHLREFSTRIARLFYVGRCRR